MLDWFECLKGSGCYSAKAGTCMAHVQPHIDQWLWSWDRHRGVSDTLEQAKLEVENVFKQAG